MAPICLTRAQARAVDEIAIKKYGMSGLVLMENAGRGGAEFIDEFVQGRIEMASWPIVICCGKGNNGGDGFVIARHLTNRGREPLVMLWADSEELAGDARANYAILEKMGAKIAKLGEAEWDAAFGAVPKRRAIVVDALLGTGAKGEPRAPYDEAIDWINSLGAIVVAIDLPSGLDCDTGAASSHTVRADYTLTFVAEKVGFQAEGAKEFLGEVRVMDIGAPRMVMEAARG